MACDDRGRADAPEPLLNISTAEQLTTRTEMYLNPSDISRPIRLHGGLDRTTLDPVASPTLRR